MFWKNKEENRISQSKKRELLRRKEKKMEEERRNEKYLEENRSKTLEETFSPLLEQKEKNFVVKRRKFLPNFFVCFSFLFWKNNKRKKREKKNSKNTKRKKKK